MYFYWLDLLPRCEVSNTTAVVTTGVAWDGSIVLGVLQFVCLGGEAHMDHMTTKEHDRFETVSNAAFRPATI